MGSNQLDSVHLEEPLEPFRPIPGTAKGSVSPGRTQVSPMSSADVEKDSGTLRGALGPADLGGLRIAATAGRPSPANRLNNVDKKWLERCQVFGELGAEEKPAAGNQERCQPNGKDEEKRADEKDEKDAMTNISVNPAPQTKQNTKDLAPLKEASRSPPKKSGKKRQREGAATEEGGAHKRRRKKSEKGDEKEEKVDRGDGKKRRGKKGKEDAQVEDDKTTKSPKKV